MQQSARKLTVWRESHKMWLIVVSTVMRVALIAPTIMRQCMAREIELVDRERPAIAVAVRIQGHVLPNVCRANQIPIEVRTQGKVI